jgi:hypothetical protein
VRDGEHHHEFLQHEVGQCEWEALHEEPPHLQVPRSPARPWRVGARGLGNHLETPAEFSEEFGSQARALAFVPVHGHIHLTDSLGVEFETNLHRR